MPDIPIELITSILSLLPIKSLLRFTCVSKSWYSLIKSHYFTNLHLKKSLLSCNKIDHSLLIVNHGCFLKPGYIDPAHGTRPARFESILLDSDECLASEVSTLVLPPQSKRVGAQICGSSNGLVAIIQKYSDDSICFLTGNFSYEVILWNPLINNKHYFTLPHIELPIGIINCVSFGFGYDPSSNDHKVVRISDFSVRGFVGGGHSCCISIRKRQVIVYNLKQQSWGKPYEEFTQDKLVLLHKYGILVNNHILHWIFFDIKSGMHKLKGFNLCLEAWINDLPLPNLLENARLKSEDVKDLGVLDGCLCLVVQGGEINDVNVWIMKDYGVKESWVKLFLFCDVLYDVVGSLSSCPIVYSKKRDEVLVRKGDSSAYFWFDLKKKKVKSFDHVVASLDVIVCNASLVLVH